MNEMEWRQFRRVVGRSALRLGDASAADGIETVRSRVGTLWPLRNPLGYLIGADFNSTADQAIALTSAGRWALRRIVVCNASISLTAAAGGVYTATSKGGDAVVAASQAYSTLTGPRKFLDLTIATIAQQEIVDAATLYLSLTTAQGAAATADVYVFGDPLPTS